MDKMIKIEGVIDVGLVGCRVQFEDWFDEDVWKASSTSEKDLMVWDSVMDQGLIEWGYTEADD